MLAGLGLARLPRPAALAGLAGVTLISWSTLQGDFGVRRSEQWREAAGYVISNARPGDGWIFISKWGQNGFEYYAGWRWGSNPDAPYGDILESFDWSEAFKVAKYRGLLSLASLEPFSVGHQRIWLVLSHEFDAGIGGDTAAPVRDWLTRHGYGATQRQFRFVRVLLYQRHDVAG